MRLRFDHAIVRVQTVQHQLTSDTASTDAQIAGRVPDIIAKLHAGERLTPGEVSAYALFTSVIAAATVLLLAMGCSSGGESQGRLPEEFTCSSGALGWHRAIAVTPDVVPPCNTGSSGTCERASQVYVSGTGWCRPR